LAQSLSSLGIRFGPLLVPQPQIDLQKWAVVACDQFTSQPEYWRDVASFVGEAPSTYHIILPEVYLGGPQEEGRIASAQRKMGAYLEGGVLREVQGPIFVQRSTSEGVRNGLVLAVDLEQYDVRDDWDGLIRASEQTVLERVPPRARIRRGAALETSHVILLMDDPADTVLGPLKAYASAQAPLYELDLMLGGGHLTGTLVDDAQLRTGMVTALGSLLSSREGSAPSEEDKAKPFLFAVGDGNHSLAAAKLVWEEIKPEVGPDHPARYALVELENLYDEAIVFEPIHRVLFGLHVDLWASLVDRFGFGAKVDPVPTSFGVQTIVQAQSAPVQKVGVVSRNGMGVLSLAQPPSPLPVGFLQNFLDDLVSEGAVERVDYIHGDDAFFELALREGNAGFYLPALSKGQLFPAIRKEGRLPRKSFSMGEARDKRFYFETRRID
jgi:hypothetical protein